MSSDRLRLLQLQLQLRQARAEQATLKQELHARVDRRRRQARLSALEQALRAKKAATKQQPSPAPPPQQQGEGPALDRG